jgi:hypothetical protein
MMTLWHLPDQTEGKKPVRTNSSLDQIQTWDFTNADTNTRSELSEAKMDLYKL